MQTTINALTHLADGCYNGACNPAGIINSLPEAMKCISPFEARTSPELKIIVGQLSYLLGESLGPTSDAIHAYLERRETRITTPPALAQTASQSGGVA